MLSRLDGGAEYKVIEGDGNTVKKEILETEAENKMEALQAFMRCVIIISHFTSVTPILCHC